MQHRLAPIDRMRGIAMVLMASDHASAAFHSGRPIADSALMRGFDAPLDPLEFAVRWASHLCAPTFVCLAGTSLALAVTRRRARGDSELAIDRDLLVRGAIVLAVEFLFINQVWAQGALLLQVMYAIGCSMFAMTLLRRLPVPLLWAFVLIGLSIGEWTRTGSIELVPDSTGTTRALVIDAGFVPIAMPTFGWEGIFCAYPVLPWCAMLVLGWIFGLRLARRPDSTEANAATTRDLMIVGAVCSVMFVTLRANNGFGNLGLPRFDDSLAQWGHVSKYPPSLTFTALELGLMCWILVTLFRLAPRAASLGSRDPLVVFGQTPLFFYVVHILVLELAARSLGLHRASDLGTALIACGITLVVLYPVCRVYRRAKSARPRSVLRYL